MNLRQFTLIGLAALVAGMIGFTTARAEDPPAAGRPAVDSGDLTWNRGRSDVGEIVPPHDGSPAPHQADSGDSALIFVMTAGQISGRL